MEITEIRNFLRSYYFDSQLKLDELSIEEQEYLKKHSFDLTLERKKTLFREGDKAGGVYYIKSGTLKAFKTNFDSSVQVLFFFRKGDYFGFRPLINNEVQPVSIAAVENSEITYIEGKHFLQVLQDSKVLLNRMIRILCHEYTVLSNRINLHAQRSVNQRLALSILILVEKLYEGKYINGEIQFTISRTDLANFVGTSLENLVRSLKSFAESGIIRMEGKTIIINDYKKVFTLTEIGRKKKDF